jgi:hypothetical protein
MPSLALHFHHFARGEPPTPIDFDVKLPGVAEFEIETIGIEATQSRAPRISLVLRESYGTRGFHHYVPDLLIGFWHSCIHS